MTREKILQVLQHVDGPSEIVPMSETLSVVLSCGLVEQIPGAECRLRLTRAGRVLLEDWQCPPQAEPEKEK